jgi:hypothetical protein
MRITYRDMVAIALGVGVKVGGGDLQKALVWALGSRALMKFINFPQLGDNALPSGPATLIQDAAGIFRQATGQAPYDPTQGQQAPSDAGSSATQYPPGTQGAQTPPPGGDIIDGDFTTGN